MEKVVNDINDEKNETNEAVKDTEFQNYTSLVVMEEGVIDRNDDKKNDKR